MAVVRRTASDDDSRVAFIDDFGRAYSRYGLSPTFGRAFGRLLTTDEPTSLEDIAERLSISQTSAHVVARQLDQEGLIRPLNVGGRRRSCSRSSTS
jgi:HTH-type transcriptional regulator, glycine betaine synthesis regulator